jgi:general secretion pathway protein H
MTPISATGASRTAARAGFTLVELLVVIVILGLAAAIAVLTLPDQRPSLGRESERLAAALIRARDQAVLSNRAAVVRLTPTGYSVHALAGPGEEVMQSEADWSAGDRIAVSTADGVEAGEAAVIFDPTGVADPAVIQILREGARATVRIDQAGQVSIDGPR